jgi:hypothetical protein
MRKMALLMALMLAGTASAASAQQPQIRRITPDVLRPGGRATIEGSRLATSGGNVSVFLGGVRLNVVSARPSRVVVALPDSGFPCAARRNVRVSVTVGTANDSRLHPFEAAAPLSVPAGADVMWSGPLGACTALTDPGNYLVAVVNAYWHPDPVLNVKLRASSPPPPSASALHSVPPPPPPPAPGFVEPAALGTRSRAALEHAAALEWRRDLFARLARGSAGAGVPHAVPAPLPTNRTHPVVGQVWPMRIAVKDSACSVFRNLSARVVHVGPHATFLEDVQTPRARPLDVLYDSLGVEYENSIQQILLLYFGDPAKYDRQLDGDGRVLVLFTNRIGRDFNGAAGMVSSCDFDSQASTAASNQGEVIYVDVSAQAGRDSTWRLKAAETLVHEGSHLASYAARMASGGRTWEETWLLEALAMQAEEIYRRTSSGVLWKGNAGAGEAGPLADDHFFYLRQFYTCPEAQSPLYDPDTAPSDSARPCPAEHSGAPPRGSYSTDSFYGSGWLLVRWTADHFSPRGEEDFFKRLVQDSVESGAANLAKQAGRPFDFLVVNWLLAAALDDRPGFTPHSPLHTVPSWNTRAVLTTAGRFPLRVTSTGTGNNAWDFEVRGASGRFFGVTVVSGAPRVLDVMPQGQATPDEVLDAMRVIVVRTR